MATEFIKCRSDLVAYHPGKCGKNIKFLHIGVQRDVLQNTGRELSFCGINAIVAELKVESVDLKAKNECFYNMFSKAVKLILKSLQWGKLVEVVTVYGITMAVHYHRFAQLQTLKMDFKGSTCEFKCSGTTSPFTELLNKISILASAYLL